MPSKTLKCFPPFIDAHSKVLILGTMPGPTALAKQEYYGFAGNHFWKIMFDFLGRRGGSCARPVKKAATRAAPTYAEKIRLLKQNGIALWDVFAACERKSALDQHIENAELNPIPELLEEYPNIKTILLNSRTAEKIFRKHFEAVAVPSYYMPSTSPANAGLSYEKKYQIWVQALTNALRKKH